MQDIGNIIGDERIPEALKVLIIVLIILAAVFAVITPFYVAYNKKHKNNTGCDNMNRNNESNGNFNMVKLEGKYTSLFAEDNKLKTEKIEITSQKNGIVEGTVTLIEQSLNGEDRLKFKYTLKGRFSNNILTGEYYSQQNNIDERGAINLKLIDVKILSGFCSFSKLSSSVEDEIRVSPYIWVASNNEEIDLLNGTFDFCTECYNEHKGCCCASDKVDMPVFLNNEIALIRNQLVERTLEKNSFSNALKSPFQNAHIRQMKRQEKKKEDGTLEYTKCHFYDINGFKCQIYKGRPLDCRLFPFDIKLSKDKTEYVIGYYTALCERNLPDLQVMKKRAHILRPYFFLLYPYLHIITSDEVCSKLKNADFQEIANFKEFVF